MLRQYRVSTAFTSDRAKWELIIDKRRPGYYSIPRTAFVLMGSLTGVSKTKADYSGGIIKFMQRKRSKSQWFGMSI